MAPEVVDAGPKTPEQPEQTSSPCACPPSRGSDTSFIGNQVPGDMSTAPGETQRTALVDAVDDAAADFLKSAVEDGPGEHWDMIEEKVWKTLFLCSDTL